MKVVTTFPRSSEFEKAQGRLDALSLPYTMISPDPGYTRVGVPALTMEDEVRAELYRHAPDAFVCSGWVNYRSAQTAVPERTPKTFETDIFNTCAIMVLASCVADLVKIRLIAHIAGDLAPVFPYLNAELPHAMYNKDGPTFTFMDGYRMISLYPHRLTVAKADEIVDAWRTLEKLRILVNDVWCRRESIQPSYEMRKKPPALEIYKRLPGTNCKACGEKTCMAFALRLWCGAVAPSRCKPVFDGEYGDLKAPFLAICAGLAITDSANMEYESLFDVLVANSPNLWANG